MAQNVVDSLLAKFGDRIEAVTNKGEEAVVTVGPGDLLEVARYLRDSPSMLCDAPAACTAVDWLVTGREPRFDLIYQLRSTKYLHRVRIKVPLAAPADMDEDGPGPISPTLSTLWKGFGWPEREVFDMYGIRFQGHADLRRILLYDEFVGYPLRKDYPKEKRQPLARRDYVQ